VTSPDSVTAAWTPPPGSAPCRSHGDCAGIGQRQSARSARQRAVPLDAFTKVINVNLIGTFTSSGRGRDGTDQPRHPDAGEERG